MATLIGLALLGLFSLGLAARNWVSSWHGLDELAMAVDSLDVAEDFETIDLTARVANQSGEVVTIHEFEVGLGLSGRSVSGGGERYNNLVLGPDEEATLETTLNVSPLDVDLLRERLESSGEVWNISGRIDVSVDDLGDPVWVPFNFELEAD